MKVVGLNITAGKIAASIVEKGLRSTELKDSFSQSYSGDAELAEILRARSASWADARIVTSVSGLRFSQRTVTFPFADRKRVEKALPFELEDAVPFSLDEVELDHLALDRDGGKDKKKEVVVVAMMVPKSVLRSHLDFLASAGIDPQAVQPSFLGLCRVASMIPTEGPTVFVEGNDLCLKDGAVVKAFRSFSDARPSGGIKRALKALETEYGTRIEKAVILSENERLRSELAGLELAIERISPDFHGKTADDAVSLGLALGDEVNFRKGEFAYRLADIGARKQKRLLIIAGAVAAVLAGVNLGVKYYLVESSYGKLDREIRELYRQVSPETRSVPDPVRQLRMKLEDAKKKFGVLGSGSSALDVMKAVTEGIPKEVRVSFQDFSLEGDRLKLQGDAESFESVDKMKAELLKAPPFADVQVLDTRMGANNKVKFRFDIKLKQAM